MAYKITKLTIQSVDHVGVTYDVEGTGGHEDTAFRIEIWCEFDGRDVESDSPEPNPMHDDALEFFNSTVCEDVRFAPLHNAAYAIWEQIRVLNEASVENSPSQAA